MDASHPEHRPQDEKYADTILKLYQHLDAKIATLLETAGPDVNVVLLSDHGFGPLYKDVFLNEWLIQEGLLATLQPITTPNHLLKRLGVNASRCITFPARPRVTLAERWLRSAVGNRLEMPLHDRATFPEAVDRSRTRCYSYGYHGQIFANLRGREPAGIVAPGTEYEALMQDVENRLSNGWIQAMDNR